MMKKEHGEHNRKLCDHLLSRGDYNDWVVTTAFYSAIHFIEHKLFPLDYGGKTLSDINSANNFIRTRSKHETRALLVGMYLSSQSADYAYLEKNCKNARYVNYKVNPETAKNAKAMLVKIETECCKPKP
ncbi:hypothetical protein BH09BAC5_BH09BAC5_10150 [soil metagenome]